MDLSNFRAWDIYNNRSKFKIVIFIIAILIGGTSIYYTQWLVNKLAEREQRMIDLYAKGLKYVVDPSNEGSLSFLFQEIIEANNSVPVILTDQNENPISDKNLDSISSKATPEEREHFYRREIQEMKEQHSPIVVEIAPGLKNYIFYKNSFLLRQLLYYPYVQLTIITIFAIIAFLAFSYSKNAEQNRVWVGLAKETAHQLGTPLSSLMAWQQILKDDPKYENDEFVVELEKDISRLEMITSRFSNIGSAPALNYENILEVLENSVKYLQTRVSKKVRFSIKTDLPADTSVKINKPLFEWVIENVCKNAADAMPSGIGEINIKISSVENNKVAIDMADTGKGMPRSSFKKVFEPGYTTKKRGWGLGLTLVKRIVENYHSGKIFVLSSEQGKGTTFRIVVNR